jgi:hypothetical protein
MILLPARCHYYVLCPRAFTIDEQPINHVSSYPITYDNSQYNFTLIMFCMLSSNSACPRLEVREFCRRVMQPHMSGTETRVGCYWLASQATASNSIDALQLTYDHPRQLSLGEGLVTFTCRRMASCVTR